MVVTEYCKSGVMLLLSPSGGATGNFFRYCIIGTGSGASASTRSGLITPVSLRQYTSYTLNNKDTTLIYDFSTSTMSGLTLKEMGFVQTSGTNPRSNAIEAFAGNSITFDGTSELQIQITFQTF